MAKTVKELFGIDGNQVRTAREQVRAFILKMVTQ
jgi:hypothetical protein